MSDIKLVSPMLDNFNIGEPISDHNGIRCCPAMKKDSDERYIVKIISVPASQVQYDALLLTGICSDRESALTYFNDLANSITDEIKTLQKLSELEGFLSVEDYQIVQMEDDVGYNVYILSKYNRTLEKQFQKHPMTHLGAINLGLDLCAALSVSRKLGYLYADLKPSNIYLSGEQGYRIGDIGFIKLDSLKYASLPEAYHSRYTAPEITDAYSALNETLDIYALGLILYQAYNGGILPTPDGETGEIAPPAYADYEMSEIILKACAPNAADRWQDPIEMGQSLVAYMQRNGANDTPIVPYTPVESTHEPVEEAEEEEVSTNDDVAPEAVSEDFVSDTYTEDSLGNLSFLDDSQDDTVPCEEDADVAYDEVSDEVSEMLSTADELISHPTPDPVVEPEAIEVPVPAPIEAEAEDVSEEPSEDPATESEEADQDEPADEAECEDSTITEEASQEMSDAEETIDETPVNEDCVENESEVEDIAKITSEPENTEPDTPKQKKPTWWRGLLIALLVAGIGVAGYFYYTLCYLQPVTMELSGQENTLTVSVDCSVGELFVTCTDSFGNVHKELVVDGEAVFNELASDTVYTVTIDTNEFHKLTGSTTASYHTEKQTKVTQFTVLNGTEAGNVVVNFTVDGTDSDQWHLHYAQEGGIEESITFSGHMTTLTGLSVGTQYTFRLEPASDLFFDANNAITFTPAAPVRAENLYVSDYAENSLTVVWSTRENVSGIKWVVQCYDGASYIESVETSELTATFTGIDPDTTYTVAVIAENMSEATTITAAKGSLSLKDFNALVNGATITLSWGASADVSGWVVTYSIDGANPKELNVSSGNQCGNIPYVPNAKYVFTVTAADGRTTINNQYNFTAEAAPAFNNYGLGAQHIRFDMCKTPKTGNWSVRDLVSSDYTTTFPANGKASFLLSIPYEFDRPNDRMIVTYVIYDEDGKYVSYAAQETVWGTMWDRGYCELDIPSIPASAGNYRIAICFNGALVNETNFTITP